MPKDIFQKKTPELAPTRKNLAPGIHETFASFSERVFADGVLAVKTKQLISVAAAHINQSPCAGGAYSRSALALDSIDDVKRTRRDRLDSLQANG